MNIGGFYIALLSVSSVLLYVYRDRTDCQGFAVAYVHKDHKDYYGRGAQDVYLHFHTAPELWFKFNVALHPQRP